MELKDMQQHIILHRRLQIINQTNSDDPFGDSEFDSNMVIILSFLLCALLFAVGLNAAARCCFLRIFRSSSPEQPAAPGLKKRALRQLPVAVYGLGPGISGQRMPDMFGEFLDGERIRVLPKCSHGFHVECIDKWLVSNGSCPNCRVSLVEVEVEPPPVIGRGGGADDQEMWRDV